MANQTISAQTIPALIKHNAANNGDAIWLVSPETGEVVTWADAYERGKTIAAGLIKLGLKTGQSVAVASPNSIGSVLSFLGITMAGGRATPMNLVAGPKVMSYVLQHSKTALIIVEDSARDDLEQAVASAGVSANLITLHPEQGPDLPMVDPGTANDLMPEITPEDVGLLMYTSGTTGNPKGVMLSHANLIAAGRNVELAHHITPDDTGLCVLPIYHINGLCVTVMGTLTSASRLVMPYKFSNRLFWDQIYQHDCSWFSAVPTLFSYILNDDAEKPLNRDRLRFARSASAPLPPETHRKFEDRFGIPIIETMGLTETGAQILSNPLPPKTRKIGSPGVGVGNEVKIINPEDMSPRPTNTEGEIVIRGNNVMIGYLDQPEETAKTITADGWLRTGDLGRMDEDGFVYVTGRIKELIIKGGENIAPREIDEVLLEHDAVLEAAAFARPCDDYGQRVEACVRLKDGRDLEQAHIIAHCHDRLGKFKSPDIVHILDDLPKGPSGKVQRMKLISLVP